MTTHPRRRRRSGLSRALATACVLAGLWPGTGARSATAGDPAQSGPALRVEARSADLLAVGIVHEEHMVIHLSRTIDNAPVRDAALNVLLRGVVHPTVAQPDGGYTLVTPDLTVPGAAALVFQVAAPDLHEDLKGAFEINGPAAKDEDKNSARQLGWWVLNFAVCIGFLLLLSRRRKAAAAAGD